MERRSFILSPWALWIGAAQVITEEKEWVPQCPICYRVDEDVEVITQEDGLVLYLCSEGHVFGEPKQFRVKKKPEDNE